jgi:hypothetical protein
MGGKAGVAEVGVNPQNNVEHPLKMEGLSINLIKYQWNFHTNDNGLILD